MSRVWSDTSVAERAGIVQSMRDDAAVLRDNAARFHDDDEALVDHALLLESLADAIEQGHDVAGPPCEVPIAVIEVRRRGDTRASGLRAPFRAIYTSLTNKWSWRRLVAEATTEAEAVAAVLRRVAERGK